MRGGSPADIALNAGSMYSAIPNALSQIFTGQGMADNFQDGMSAVNRLNRESGYEGDSLRFPPYAVLTMTEEDFAELQARVREMKTPCSLRSVPSV